MIQYKEIFTLAESKGYACWYDENIITNDTTSKQKYIEMSLIQKWLRDIHRIDLFFDVEGVTNRKYKVILMDKPDAEKLYIYYEELFSSAEAALFFGISEALQLI